MRTVRALSCVLFCLLILPATEVLAQSPPPQTEPELPPQTKPDLSQKRPVKKRGVPTTKTPVNRPPLGLISPARPPRLKTPPPAMNGATKVEEKEYDATDSVAGVPVAGSDAPVIPGGPIPPRPHQADACLYDVQFLGSKNGWAVGDHGVIWKTTDAGATWQLLRSPVDCPLRSVCFLTQNVGWIVGGGTRPYCQMHYGVVLFTRDGGTTWQVYPHDGTPGPNPDTPARLPRLHYVKFFGLKDGVVVGEATEFAPSGVLRTSDGGKTWLPVHSGTGGREKHGWRTAAFAQSAEGMRVGVVGGTSGRTAFVGDNQLLENAFGFAGARGLHDVCLLPDDQGWMVGDGALVRHSVTGGVSWTDPPGDLPFEIRDVFDFRAVWARGRFVWIAGSPGSVIFHSKDGGKSWESIRTGQTIPIRALEMTSAGHGWAVGDLGVMLHSKDGGKTWSPTEKSQRRAAMLVMSGSARRISFPLIAQQSAEDGYRSVAVVPSRRDMGPDGFRDHDLDLRLHEAVTRAGGSAGTVDWQFPLNLPDIENNRAALIADWNRRLEGNLRDRLPERLAAHLRTWKPTTVVLDGATDANTQLINAAMYRAIQIAADANELQTHVELADLPPWTVKRVFARSADESSGRIVVDPQAWLPRQRSTARQLASASEHILKTSPHLRKVGTKQSWNQVLSGDNSAGHFFSGIVLQPGSPPRRELLPKQDDESSRLLAERQRNVLSFARSAFHDTRSSTAIVAELKPMTRGLAPDRAAQLLSDLARISAEHEGWATVRDINQELVDRFPEQPVSAAAMADLFIRSASEEITWQTARAQERAGHDKVRNNSVRQVSLEKRDIEQPGQIVVGPQKTTREQFVGDRRAAAAKQIQQIREFWPELLTDTQVRFSIASLLRQRGAQGAARGFLGRLVQSSKLWQQTAQSELWIANPVNNPLKSLAVVRPARKRPHLDALLSDETWQGAQEIVLSDEDANSDEATPGSRPILMFARDNRFLYLAGSIPRDEKHPARSAEDAGRTYDADLTNHDRIVLYLDTDRDYSTYYTLAIDERGWTNDSCHDHVSWNPRWFVATDGDERRWRFEVAIPLEELVPVMPATDTVWAMGVSRIIPSVKVQSWTQPVSAVARPETFGLLRFD